MPVVQTYPARVAEHADLKTTQVRAVRTAHGRFPGWDVTETPLAVPSVHHLGQLDGKAAASLAQAPARALDAGTDLVWSLDFQVAFANRTLETSEQTGDVTSISRFAVEDTARVPEMMDSPGAAIVLFWSSTQVGFRKAPGLDALFGVPLIARVRSSVVHRRVLGGELEQHRVKQDSIVFGDDSGYPMQRSPHPDWTTVHRSGWR